MSPAARATHIVRSIGYQRTIIQNVDREALNQARAEVAIVKELLRMKREQVPLMVNGEKTTIWKVWISLGVAEIEFAGVDRRYKVSVGPVLEELMARFTDQPECFQEGSIPVGPQAPSSQEEISKERERLLIV